MKKIQIPVHECTMHKEPIGFSTSAKEIITHYQCMMCHTRWDESQPTAKTMNGYFS